ncbi:uncharacterized protein [Narcine bancroftii]|uniref:uncharacterized protein n=1 Tax=Narcine bancroftii TaxID=1343680 RepID=UPI00383143FC
MDTGNSMLYVEFPNYSSSLLENLNQQRMEGKFCDISIHVQDKVFKAHRAVLAASSPYFHDQVLFRNTSRLVLPGVMDSRAFEGILASCYAGRLAVLRADIVSYLTVGSFLQMWHVVDKCTELLRDHLPPPATAPGCQPPSHAVDSQSPSSSNYFSPREAGEARHEAEETTVKVDEEEEEEEEEEEDEEDKAKEPEQRVTSNQEGDVGGADSLFHRPDSLQDSSPPHKHWVFVKKEKQEDLVLTCEEDEHHFVKTVLCRHAEPQSLSISGVCTLAAPGPPASAEETGLEEPVDYCGSSEELADEAADEGPHGLPRPDAGVPLGGCRPQADACHGAAQAGASASAGGKMFACHCGKAFTHKSQRDRHINMHLNLRPFACTICSKKFKMKHHLVEHMKIHTGLKPFECHICGKKFMWRDSFLRHKVACEKLLRATSLNPSGHCRRLSHNLNLLLCTRSHCQAGLVQTLTQGTADAEDEHLEPASRAAAWLLIPLAFVFLELTITISTGIVGWREASLIGSDKADTGCRFQLDTSIGNECEEARIAGVEGTWLQGCPEIGKNKGLNLRQSGVNKAEDRNGGRADGRPRGMTVRRACCRDREIIYKEFSHCNRVLCTLGSVSFDTRQYPHHDPQRCLINAARICGNSPGLQTDISECSRDRGASTTVPVKPFQAPTTLYVKKNVPLTSPLDFPPFTLNTLPLLFAIPALGNRHWPSTLYSIPPDMNGSVAFAFFITDLMKSSRPKRTCPMESRLPLDHPRNSRGWEFKTASFLTILSGAEHQAGASQSRLEPSARAGAEWSRKGLRGAEWSRKGLRGSRSRVSPSTADKSRARPMEVDGGRTRPTEAERRRAGTDRSRASPTRAERGRWKPTGAERGRWKPTGAERGRWDPSAGIPAAVRCGQELPVPPCTSGRGGTPMDTGMFQVEFPNFGNNLLRKLNQQRMEGKLCDITIHLQGQMFRAHRAVLAASSPYFHDQVLLKNASRIVLPGVMSPKAFENVLASSYTGKLTILSPEIVSYLTVASFLQMWHVVDKCTELLQESQSNPLPSRQAASQNQSPSSSNYLSPWHGPEPGTNAPAKFERPEEEDIKMESQREEDEEEDEEDEDEDEEGQKGPGSASPARETEQDNVISNSAEREKAGAEGGAGASNGADCPYPTTAYNQLSIVPHKRWVLVKTDKSEGAGSPGSEEERHFLPTPGKRKQEAVDHEPSHFPEHSLAEEYDEFNEDPGYDEPVDYYGSSDDFHFDRMSSSSPGGPVLQGNGLPGEIQENGAYGVLGDPGPSSCQLPAGSDFPGGVYKLYPCQCGKSFAHKSQRDRHMSMHLNVRPFGCPICNKKFKMKHHLMGHMKIHTGHKPYECHYCGKKFMWRDSFTRHHNACSKLYHAAATPLPDIDVPSDLNGPADL